MFALHFLVKANLKDDPGSEREAAGGIGAERKLEGPGVGSILANEKDRSLFLGLAPHWGVRGEQLAKKLNPAETPALEQDPVTQEWVQGSEPVLEDLDIALITEWRQEFLRRKEMAAQAEKLCTPDIVSEAASYEPLLQRAMEAMGEKGSEKIRAIIVSQIENMAFGGDSVNFENFVSTLERVAEMQAGEQRLEARIEEYVRNYGLSMDAYEDIINTGDPQIRSGLLFKAINDRKSLFGRLRQGTSLDQAIELNMTEERLQILQAETDGQMGELGGILGILRKSAPDMQRLISRAILEPDASKPEEAGRAENAGDAAFAEVRSQAPQLQNYAESWKAMQEQTGYYNLPPGGQDDIRDQFLDRQFGGKPRKGIMRTTYAFLKRVMLIK